MEYALKTDGDETILILSDGSIATFHNNGEHIIATMFQNRVELFTFNYRMWNALDDGKVYIKDWHTKQEVDSEVVLDALNWLYAPSTLFNQVDFDGLVHSFNNNQTESL